jgi:hypothetical protein
VTGQCASTPCPTLPFEVSPAFHIDCETDNQCHASRAPEKLSFLYSFNELHTFSPNPGDTFADIRDLEIAWQATGTAVLVLVLDQFPTSQKDMAEHTVWIASRTAADTAQVTWRDGYQVSPQGDWRAVQSDFQPEGFLFIVVEAVDGENLEDLSVPIEIASGREFPSAGAPCASETGAEGECHNPQIPQTCSEHHCRSLCASDTDCRQGTLCELPQNGLRFCGL